MKIINIYFFLHIIKKKYLIFVKMELRILPMDLNFDNNLKQWAEVVLEIVDIDKTKLSPKNIIFIEEASRSGVESESWGT